MSVKECRICYEDENENSKEMINPCVCSGTQNMFMLIVWNNGVTNNAGE